jgi:hypothetical protein
MALLNRSSKTGSGTGPSSRGPGRRGAAGKGSTKVGAKAPKTKRPRGERFAQIKAAWTMTRQSDSRLLPLTVGAFLGALVIGILLGLLVGPLVVWVLLGLVVGVLAATFVFGRRVQSAAFAGVEGQPGAAAAVLQAMRGDWRVQPAIAANRDQELVHLVLGRPGVVLVAEAGVTGAHRGTRNLIANEKKRLSRVLSTDTPVYDVLVGDEEGQVPLRGLEKHFLKLPRNIKPAEVNQLEPKLKALGRPLPIPKGPMPRSGRVPRR